MTTNQKISLAFLTKVAAGMDVKDAFDAVLGQGVYDKMVGDLYDALRAKAAA